MRPKVGLVGKTFSAFWAIEWFLTCMGSDMTLKMKKDIFIEVNTKRKIYSCQRQALTQGQSHISLLTIASQKMTFNLTCSNQGRLNLLPQYGHSQPWLCVRTCMLKAGIDTYTFSQWGHFRAFLSLEDLWVCRCRARLLEVLYLFPHSSHG